MSEGPRPSSEAPASARERLRLVGENVVAVLNARFFQTVSTGLLFIAVLFMTAQMQYLAETVNDQSRQLNQRLAEISRAQYLQARLLLEHANGGKPLPDAPRPFDPDDLDAHADETSEDGQVAAEGESAAEAP